MVDDWRRGAGLLISARDEAGTNYVLLGDKRPSSKPLKRMLASFNFPLHGWSIPFGALDHADEGSFAKCAIREAAQEVFGLQEGLPYKDYEKKLRKQFGPLPEDLTGALQPVGGWSPEGLASLPGGDHRVFFLRVRYEVGTFPVSYEFPNGVRWCVYESPDLVKVDGAPLGNPRHWALESTLRHFQTLITADF